MHSSDLGFYSKYYSFNNSKKDSDHDPLDLPETRKIEIHLTRMLFESEIHSTRIYLKPKIRLTCILLAHPN